jgi:glycosyltransferase involved in cell wall biosynthesis
MKSVDLARIGYGDRSGTGGDDGESGLPTVFLMANHFATGGTETQFVRLTKALSPEKFRIRIGCIRRQGPLLQTLEVARIAEFRLDGGFFTSTALRSACALAQHLRENSVEIAHSFSLYSNLLMIPIARMAGIAVVIGSQRQLGDLLTPRQRRAQNVCFRLCDRVVCNSRAAAESLLGRNKEDMENTKVVIISNAVSQECFDAGDASRKRPAGTIPTIGLVARMNTRAKNHELFLFAAARLVGRQLPVRALLIGDGPRRVELEELAHRLDLADCVTFLGERRDVPHLLANLDILVLTSSSESSPNVIAEAMAAGVPVVATRVGGVPELLTHGVTGMLVSSADEVELADSLEYCLRHPEVSKRLAQRARQFAAAHFSVEAVRTRYEHLYAVSVRLRHG